MTPNDFVKITVQDTDYYLLKQPDDKWLFTYHTPDDLNLNPTVVTFVTSNGKVIVQTSDELLARTIAYFVSTKIDTTRGLPRGQTSMGKRMFKYYPYVIQELLEFQAMIQSLGFEIDFLRSEMYVMLDDAFLETMGEARISEWEEGLGLSYSADDTLKDRRDAIIGRIRGGYKLNSASIQSIVNAFTGGSASSWFVDSCINVEIYPPPNGEQYKFSNVERELLRRIPAHLNLKVFRGYSTWQDIHDIKDVNENYISWDDLKSSFTDWEGVKLFLESKTQNTLNKTDNTTTTNNVRRVIYADIHN